LRFRHQITEDGGDHGPSASLATLGSERPDSGWQFKPPPPEDEMLEPEEEARW